MKTRDSFRWSLGPWLFLLVVAGLLGSRIWWVPEEILGDWQEYFLTAQAIANHASPDIRLKDTQALEGTLSVPAFRESIQGIGAGIAAGVEVPAPGFVKAVNGSVYAIHYFGYSAMAAVVHGVTGLPFSYAFKAVNALFVLILAAAAYRFLGSFRATAAALLLFMLCGGDRYLTWQSPEVVSAAGLLAALILMHCGSVGLAAILLGLAAMQNPTIIFSFGIVPAFYLLARGIGWIPQVPWAGIWSRPRTLAAVALGGALALLPIVFNLWAFRTPNIIAKLASDTSLIGWDRLHSFFLDLNQGMAPNAVGLLVGCVIVLACGLRRPARGWHAPSARYMLLAVVLSVAMAIPTLAAPNWNSGAFGMMRYAFWAAMPFLFALLVGVTEKRSLRPWVFAVAIGLQLLTGLLGYPEVYVKHTRLADWVMGRHPSLYNPDPEIFVERLRNREDALDSRQVYVFWYGKQPSKVLYHGSNLDIQHTFCDAQSRISDRVDSAAAARGWQYLNGAITCDPGPQRMMTVDLAHFARKDGSSPLVSGWSTPQADADPLWQGAWSLGERSVLRLRLESPQTIDAVHFSGHYYGNNRDTRVWINGIDFGLFPLGPDGNRVPIRGRLGQPVDTLTIELVHQNPRSPLQDGAADPRVLAFFLRAVGVQFH